MASLENMATGKSTFIRLATVEDVEAIKDVTSSAYSKYIDRMGFPPAPMMIDFQQEIQKRDREVHVLSHDDEVKGSITLIPEPETNSLQVCSVVVDVNSQGRGFGRILMEFAESQCRERGFEAVTLYTNVKMHENIVLYNRLGFQEMKRQTDGPYERVYFRKLIREAE